MTLHLFSSDFRTTPVEAREKIHVAKEAYHKIHASLMKKGGLEDLVILSTCNRLELYLLKNKGNFDMAGIPDLFFDALGVRPDPLVHFRYLTEQDALVHLFKVASSLSSLVVGEPQILGQVKASFEQADQMSKIGGIMRLIFECSFSTAKRVRNETAIHKQAISIGSTAVKLAHKVFEDFQGKTVLVIGAGEMAELAVESLQNYGPLDLMVANRSFDNAVKLAEKHKGSAISFDALPKNLHLADIVISSTGSKDFILTEKMVTKAMIARKYEPMFLIDIAVPRDIDPTINKLENVYFYDIDDLKSISEENLLGRLEEAKKAEGIVEEESRKLTALLKLRMNSHIIKTFRDRFLEGIEKEIVGETTGFSSLSEDEKERMRKSLRRWGNKMLHKPTLLLREIISEEDAYFLDHFSRIYDIQFSKKPEASHQNKIIHFNAKQN